MPEVYKKRMGVAFGIWFDRRWRELKGFFPDQVERNYYTPENIACKINAAMQWSDRYVWIWSESVIWWKGVLRKDPKNSIGVYREALAEAKKPKPYGHNALTWSFTPPEPATKRKPQAPAPDPFAALKKISPVPTTSWTLTLDPDDVGQRQGWYKPSWQGKPARPIDIAATWESQGVIYDGMAWYRRDKLSFPKQPKGKKLYLAFEACDEQSWVYIDGKHVGGLTGRGEKVWQQAFTVDVTAFAGKALPVAIAVHDSVGAGGIYRSVYFATD